MRESAASRFSFRASRFTCHATRNTPRVFLLVLLLIIAWIGFYGWLAVRRHEAHQSAAMDLGYTDQVVWNTIRGRPFEFSTYQNAPIDLPLETFARTDHLLGYHTEILLAPISLLYLIRPAPETLLIFQAVVIGLGAIPAFLLARRRLRSDLAGLAFAAAYLLAPALQGAVLSDFHAVALTASLLLWAFWFLEMSWIAAYFACIIAVLLVKEDMPLVVALLGAVIVLTKGPRRVGLATLMMGIGWFVIANRAILPHFSGLTRSPFFDRLALFGPTPEASVEAALRDPLLVIMWLTKPEVLIYLAGLLSTVGFMSIFGLAWLLPAAPVLGVNILSAWNWTYSEGAHYSASVVPFIILSGIYGMGWLAGRLGRRQGGAAAWIAPLSAAMLLIAVAHHLLVGVSPLTPRFAPPRVTDHHRIGQALMASIPPDAAVSAQSDLYPHLSQRRKAYLFPAVEDAEYVLVDVSGSTYPLSWDEHFWAIQGLLETGEFGVVDARDGYLLLRRGEPEYLSGKQLASFLSFVRADEADIAHPLNARFGDALELVGYDYAIRPVVHATERPATVATYWRALKPLDQDYGFAFFFTRNDGAVVGSYAGPLAATLWYPPTGWQPGEIVKIETPVLSVGRLKDVLVAVTEQDGDPEDPIRRLKPHALPGGGAEVVGDGTLLKAFSFGRSRQ